jgi:hypothetical protein
MNGEMEKVWKERSRWDLRYYPSMEYEHYMRENIKLKNIKQDIHCILITVRTVLKHYSQPYELFTNVYFLTVYNYISIFF